NHTHPPPVPSSSEPNFWAPKLWVKLMPEAAVASSNRIVLAGVACANRAHESAKTLNIRTSTSGLLYGIAGLSRLDRQALWISPAPQAPHFLARAPVRYGSQRKCVARLFAARTIPAAASESCRSRPAIRFAM